MANLLWGLIVLFGVLVLYFLFWPVSPKPVGIFEAPTPSPLKGVYEVNTRLQAVKRLGDGHCLSPESIAFDLEGRIYAGMADGRIMRFDPTGDQAELFVNTEGRPLGLAFDRDENLIVADQGKGLLSVTQNGDLAVLATKAAGHPIRFANDLDIADDGTVYFSDFQFHPHKDIFLDIVDGRPLTRLLAYSPKTQMTWVVCNGLYNANGVALGPGDSYVLVCEYLAYRVTRYWLSGPNQGQREPFIENLPGMPDNISFNDRDTFWLALFGPRDPSIETLQANPSARAFVKRLPPFLLPDGEPAAYGFVLGLDMNGNIKHNFQDPSGKYASHITSAYEHEGALYLGNIGDTAIKKLALT